MKNLVFSILGCLLLFSASQAKTDDFPTYKVDVSKNFVLVYPYAKKPMPGPVSLDPIRFVMRASKDTLKIGEQVEILITAELLNISPSSYFFFDEQKSFSLKLLLPEGFVQTDGNYYDFIGGTLSYPSQQLQISLKGYFKHLPTNASIMLLRGPKNVSDRSLFEAKATWTPIIKMPNNANARVMENCEVAAPIRQQDTYTIPCEGVSPKTTISVSGCSVETWWDKGTGNWTVTTGTEYVPAGIYSFKCKDDNCPVSLFSSAVSIEVVSAGSNIPTPTISGPTQSCPDETVTLTASNCAGTYVWQDGSTGNSKSEQFPWTAKTYTVRCKLNGCLGPQATHTISAKPFPAQPSLSPSNEQTFCQGGAVTLTCNQSANGYEWFRSTGGPSGRIVGGQSFSVNESGAGNYYYSVVVEGSNGCKSQASNTVSIIVLPLPDKPTLGSNPVSPIPINTNTKLTGTCPAGTTLSWANVGNPDSVPAGTYQAECINTATGCRSGFQSITITNSNNTNICPISVTPDASKEALRCGEEFTLYVAAINCSGGAACEGISYSWSGPTSGTGTPFRTNAPSTQGTYDYTLTASKLGCPSVTGSVRIGTTCTICLGPTLGVTTESSTCGASNGSITASGADQYKLGSDGTWGSSGVFTGRPEGRYTVFGRNLDCPDKETSYPVTIANSNVGCGCGTAAPTAADANRCGQGTLTLTASNCSGTYRWYTSGGVFITTGATYSPTITKTTVYAVSCLNGCESSQTSVTAIVNPLPNPDVNSETIAPNASATLTVTNCLGRGYVSWSDGATGSTRTVRPTTTTTYIATCDDGTCSSSVISVVTVSACEIFPTVNSPDICEGMPVTLSVGNCPNGSVRWNDGVTGSTRSVSPAVSTDYVATCTIGTCAGTATANVIVNPKPKPSLPDSVTITAGQSTTLTLSNCVGGTVSWNTGTKTTSITVTPSTTTTYVATCDNGLCSGIATTKVKVTNCTVNPTVNSPIICAGSPTTLTISNCTGGISWSTGATTASIGVTPSSTTSYNVTCTVMCCNSYIGGNGKSKNCPHIQQPQPYHYCRNNGKPNSQ